MRLTAVFEKVDDWWIAYVEEIPGVNTQGRTLKEARENLEEAVKLIIDANRQLAHQKPKSGRIIREEIVVNV